MAGTGVSAASSEYAASEMPVSEMGEATPAPHAGFPPYPPYATEPAPPSVADTIMAGRDLRVQYKSMPKKSVRPPPKQARPRGPKATDVRMNKRAARAHARCLRRHGAVLTDRLERLSKPIRRTIIYLWREYAHTLPPETIARLRSMLDADEPFKPDQAYEYFVNLRKTKKKAATSRGVNQIKKDMLSMCADRRFLWARNATVAFARGIQQRLSRPGAYALADGMLRLSNIILEDLCGHSNMRPPSRRCTHPKAKFMLEMSDKVAVWIDEILAESDDRMLMMDFDEDDEVEQSNAAGDSPDTENSASTPSTVPSTAASPASTPAVSTPAPSKTNVLGADEIGDSGFTDNFLNMMGDGGGQSGQIQGTHLIAAPPAYLKFSGEMLQAFMILTDSMYKKQDEQLISYGKFNATYKEGADELKQTQDLDATEYNSTLANQLKNDLAVTAKPNTPSEIAPYMKDMVNICSNYLAQHAEFNKDKGPAFRQLVKVMRAKGNEQLYMKGKAKRTYGKAATELENARGLETDHDDPNLSQEIHSKLSKLVETETPDDLKEDMKETVDLCSKYLSQRAIDEIERGPAFDILIKELEKNGAEPFTPQFPSEATNFAAAYTLKSAPGFSGVTPDPSTVPIFKEALHKSADIVTPKALVKDMKDVIDRCSNYLSAFVRDRDVSLKTLLKMMKSKPNKVMVKRGKHEMKYGTAVTEIENAPLLVPFAPIKDVADDAKSNLAADMQNHTPPQLQMSMKALLQDVSRYLSQPFAIRSGIAGERYPLNFLSAVKNSLGNRPLFKFKAYGQTYKDAAETLKYAGPLEPDPKSENLQHQITSEMNRGVPTRLAPTITSNLKDTMDDAAKFLANVGTERGEALQHLVNIMKEEGDAPLGKMQGYQQSYKDGARRIENSNSLANEKVDQAVYESVKEKLTAITEKKPSPENAKAMPEIVDETAKFLAAPLPETDKEKRRVLADLMARKEDEILGKEGIYKITYTEAGEEIMNAPVGVKPSQDADTKQILQKVNDVIPEKRLQDALKDPANEGSTYLADIIKGRGEAMQVIHDGLNKEKDKDLLTVGKFTKTHEQGAEMLESATHFGGQHPSSILVDKVAERIKDIPMSKISEKSKPFIEDTSKIATEYIAGAAEECGLDAKAIADLDGKDIKVDVRPLPPVIPKTEPLVKKASIPDVKSTVADKSASEPIVKEPSIPAAKSTVAVKSASAPSVDTDEERRRREAEEEMRRQAEEESRRKAEDEMNRKRREAEEAERRKLSLDRAEEEAERRRRALEAARRRAAGGQGLDSDPEHEQAMQILHGQLRAHGAEVFYKQPHAGLTHAQASEWLSIKPPLKIDNCVKESNDAARLHKKFERKLDNLVSKIVTTSSEIYDTMQDVIIESSRILSEYFVSKSYKLLVRRALISEMQNRGNEILIEVNGAAETYFFAAQRLKKTPSLEAAEPCSQVAYGLTKKLEDIMRCRSMARKLTSAMKVEYLIIKTGSDHIKEAADYLSAFVTKADEKIEAYIVLLNEMETAGDSLLIEGYIPKSHKDAATYLRQLTSFQDEISQPNAALQSTTEGKLKRLTASVEARGYTKAVMDRVINESTRLLVSYIILQGMKTEALKVLIENMDRSGQNILLRHGTLWKTYSDGADILRPKNTDQLGVISADPVVARKIQIKLRNLMYSCTPDKYKTLMDDVLEDATLYLAVHFLQPRLIQVCKCMKNVFVQCELWCDEILRRIARPCCTCSRHISVQALTDLAAPGEKLRGDPSSSRAYAPGVEITLKPCPSKPNRAESDELPCPSIKPTEGCTGNATTSYLLYSTIYHHGYGYNLSTNPTSSDSVKAQSPASHSSLSTAGFSDSPKYTFFGEMQPEYPVQLPVVDDRKQESTSSPAESFYTPKSSRSDSFDLNSPPLFFNSPTNFDRLDKERPTEQPTSSKPPITETISAGMAPVKRGYTARAPIVTTDEMADWHAMMVSLMWNVQAWRAWIQENINRAVTYQCYSGSNEPEAGRESWTTFQRRVSTEALQWRQYTNFSRQLTLRLALRYRDKKIVSPTRATVMTDIYMGCQKEILDIVDMFSRWTQWLTLVIRESDSIPQRTDSQIPPYELRWTYFKMKVEEYLMDWNKYNTHLNKCWEQKYITLLADWIPASSWGRPGPVWVVSACGAVPSGAVAAGVYEGEVTWLARTTHRCKVLPAALHPSKHCCILYSDGAVHQYTKYQVMCNAEVSWMACRAVGTGGVGGVGELGARAVRVASGVHVGRVQYRGSHLVGAVYAPAYRCHVVIFGRPFAFNCYELLVLQGEG